MTSKSGILETKGGNVKHKKDLWVVIKDTTLYIYKEENQTSDPIDWFSLSGADVRVVDTKESKSARDFCFVVSSPRKLFKDHKFYPKTESEMNAWIQAISSNPSSKSGYKAGSMSNLFGVDLEVSCYKSKSTIPSVITQCIDYLQKHIDVQGIFRISASSTDVDSLKASFDSGADVNLNAISDPNIVANVMKLYLRELPNPLIPYEMYDKFVFVSKESKDNQLTHTTELFRELPKNNQDTLAFLFQFLKKVSERDSVNKMTAQNLAVVFAPSILKPREETMTTIGNSEIINSLVEKWILNYDVVFKAMAPRSVSPVDKPAPVAVPSLDAVPKRPAPSPIKRAEPGQQKPPSFANLPNMEELNAKLKAPVPQVNVTSPGQPRPLPLKRADTGAVKPGSVSANPLPGAIPGQVKRNLVADPNFKNSLPSHSLDSMIKKEPDTGTNLKPTRSTDRPPSNRLSAGNLPTGVNIPPPVAPMATLPPPINLPPPIVSENKLAPPPVRKSPSMEEGLSALLAKPTLEDKLKALEDLQARNAELIMRIQKHVAPQ